MNLNVKSMHLIDFIAAPIFPSMSKKPDTRTAPSAPFDDRPTSGSRAQALVAVLTGDPDGEPAKPLDLARWKSVNPLADWIRQLHAGASVPLTAKVFGSRSTQLFPRQPSSGRCWGLRRTRGCTAAQRLGDPSNWEDRDTFLWSASDECKSQIP